MAGEVEFGATRAEWGSPNQATAAKSKSPTARRPPSKDVLTGGVEGRGIEGGASCSAGSTLGGAAGGGPATFVAATSVGIIGRVCGAS